MNEYGVTTFSILAAAGFLGALAVIPYSLEMAAQSPLVSQTQSVSEIRMLPQLLQALVMALFVSGIGLLAAKAVGLPIWSRTGVLPAAAIAGIAAAGILLGLELLVFLPRMPAELASADMNIALWKRFTASFYGGITEELLMRLFIMSGLVWLLRFLWHTPEGTPATGVVWAAIIITAILFGLGHLPATKMITALTPLIITRAIILNGLVGILCGWLFWKHGLIAAMTAHFSADIVLHVITPLLTGRG